MGIKLIAECGCNFKSISEAYKMIERAKECNLFAVKFQLFSKEQAKSTGTPEFLSLSKKDAYSLFNYGYSIDMEIFFTPMYLDAVDWCEDFGVKYYKIRYWDNHNKKLIERVRSTKKPYFISCQPKHVKRLHPFKKQYLLFCIPHYPANLFSYPHKLPIGFFGYSDHTPDLKLLEIVGKDKIYYFEKHVRISDDCLEKDWSVSFDELEVVLKNG